MIKVARGYSHDTEIIFILERVHSISMYFSVIVYMIPNQYKSFRNEFIPVFIPNKILVLVRNFILWHHVNWKRTSFRIENCRSSSLGRIAHAYPIWRENHVSENTLGEAVRLYHVNAERTSLWNETHYGMKVITVSFPRPLTFRGLVGDSNTVNK